MLITLEPLVQISQMRYRWNPWMKTSSSQKPNLVYGLMMPSWAAIGLCTILLDPAIAACSYISFWFIVPNMIFKKMGGMDFLLRCDFECSSLAIKLSAFHQQALLYWKLIYNHNFTPHNTPVWNNRYIRLSRKSVYIEEWKSNGIWAVAHFLETCYNMRTSVKNTNFNVMLSIMIEL